MGALHSGKKIVTAVTGSLSVVPRASAIATFPIVGIGASAGGLEAFTSLLKAMPADTGMAFVLIQHLAPTHKSELSRVLSSATLMPVSEVADRTLVEPNHVYVIPANTAMTLKGGELRLAARQAGAGPHLVVNRFLASLAEERKSAAIGVILSGAASECTEGLMRIKAEGGVTFAQDIESALHSGMPSSAASAGYADFVLTPEKIADELNRMARHPYIKTAHPAEASALADAPGDAFHQICRLLSSATHVDFLQYKPATIGRRIARRMALNGAHDLNVYLERVRKDQAELELLFEDILIQVTGFFSDAATFHALQTGVLSKIAANKRNGSPIRIWVPGCSTGEEVYSLVMALLEVLEDYPSHGAIQVFGTDISEPSIQKARNGIYSETEVARVSKARLRQFFVQVQGGYQVDKFVRQSCVFARHDLTKDPPFSKLDLVSCRNVLTYLGPGLQQKSVEAFHYALQPQGKLLLGASESLDGYPRLFQVEDKKHKIFSRTAGSTPHRDPSASRQSVADPDAPAEVLVDMGKAAQRLLLERFAPPSIVVDADLHIVHFEGDTGSYVEPIAGEPSFHLTRMILPALLPEVRAVILKARQSGTTASSGEIQLDRQGRVDLIRVEATPLRGCSEKAGSVLVLFLAQSAPYDKVEPLAAAPSPTVPNAGDATREIVRLKRELAAAAENFRSILEDHSVASEALRAANEEVLSANEELQSANEELETSKEELQSTNEELMSLNAELQSRNAELAQASSDLANMMAGVSIPIVILDRGLRIRRFTPPAQRILNLIPADAGRLFSHIEPNVIVHDWESLFSNVLDDLQSVDREVRDNQGRWFSMRVRPYRTAGNKIDGVLMAFLDIDPVKRSLELAQQAREYAEAIVETIRDPLLVLDAKLCVLSANTKYYRKFRTTPGEVLGWPFFAIQDNQWNLNSLRQRLERVLDSDHHIDDFELSLLIPETGLRHLLLTARSIHHVQMGKGLILLSISDITRQVDAAKALEKSEAHYRAVVESQTELIARFLPDGTLTFVNEAYRRCFGKPAEELTGQNIRVVFEAESDWVAFQQFLSGFSLDTPVRQSLRQTDGPGRPWRQWTTRAFFDEQGRIAEFQSVGRDITALKHTEMALLQSQEKLRTLTANLISVDEANRKKLARELHDVFSQRLAVWGMQISALSQGPAKSAESIKQQLRQAAEQISSLAGDIHQMSRRLHPSVLDDLGLVAALKNECEEFARQHQLPLDFHADGVPARLPEDVALCLYRVAQESLRNIYKHAGKTEVRVSLTGDPQAISLIVEDFGAGFDPESTKGHRGLGLVSMDERVRLVNGAFAIRSEPGMGTHVEIQIPLPGSGV